MMQSGSLDAPEKEFDFVIEKELFLEQTIKLVLSNKNAFQ